MEGSKKQGSNSRTITTIILIVLTLILGVSVYAFLQKENREYQRNLKKMSKIQDEVDKQILSGKKTAVKTGNNSSDSLLNQNTGTISTGNQDDLKSNTGKKNFFYDTREIDKFVQSHHTGLDIKDLRQEYSKYVRQANYIQAIEVLEKIYQKTKQKDILYTLVDKLIEVNKFDKALKYVKMIYEDDPQLENMNINVFFYVMLNSLDYTSDNIARLNNLVDKMYKKNRLEKKDYEFYNVILLIAQRKFDKVKNKIEKLKKYKKYKSFVKQLEKSYKQFEQRKDVPQTYLHGLIGLVLFKEGYFKLANNISIEIVKKDSDYILPNQILAYSNFVTGHYEEAIKYFKKLLKIDYQNKDKYNFFRGISEFWQGNYDNAVIYLSQIKEGKYQTDGWRYIALSYYYRKSYDKMIDYFTKIFLKGDSSPYDYYTYFDIVLHQPWKKDKDFEIFKENIKQIAKALLVCYKNVPKEQKYVCRYGKAGYYFARGKETKAQKYLEFISKKYKKGYLYQSLGDFYFEKGEKDKARKTYMKAIMYTANENKKKTIKKDLIKLFMDK